MEPTSIIAIVFFNCVIVALHPAVVKMLGKRVCRKEWSHSRRYHWKWLLRIDSIFTVAFIGILDWFDILALV